MAATPVKEGPRLGIDLDGCVDEYPVFFSNLTRCWPGEVHVISFRDDRGKAEADLRSRGIRWDHLTLVSSFDAKAAVIREKAIDVYFDDQPEMLKNVAPECAVMLVRNEGNFDFGDRLWMFSRRTGKIVA